VALETQQHDLERQCLLFNESMKYAYLCERNKAFQHKIAT